MHEIEVIKEKIISSQIEDIEKCKILEGLSIDEIISIFSRILRDPLEYKFFFEFNFFEIGEKFIETPKKTVKILELLQNDLHIIPGSFLEILIVMLSYDCY